MEQLLHSLYGVLVTPLHLRNNKAGIGEREHGDVGLHTNNNVKTESIITNSQYAAGLSQTE